MASAVYILDLKGKPLIWRNFRGDVPSNIPEKFAGYVRLLLGISLWYRILDEEDMTLKPIIERDGLLYLSIKHNNLYST